MNSKLQDLKTLLLEANDLASAANVLVWDQTTYMPPGGGPARARQLATLERLAHEKFTSPAIGKLLDALRPYEESLPYDSDEASLIRATRREYERKVKVPADFVGRFSAHTAETYDAWTTAKPANNWARMMPYLEKTLDLSREYANYFPGSEHIADPLIDRYDFGMKASSLRALFAELRAQLVPLVQAVTARPPLDDSCVFQRFPEGPQLAFGLEVIRRLGYDFERGRQDKTHHPFMVRFALGDIRITTHVKENDLRDALFSTIHESGHAMYEQGINLAHEGTPLAEGTSAGVHESQSRLWENVVGRSRGFWEFFYPRLQSVFPDQLGKVSLETFYGAINKVERSLIRMDADEVTYNLHVMLRLDFELQLLEGSLSVRDLPEAWHERMETDLGIAPTDDATGVLQDVHWFSDHIGGVFQGYTLGNIMSAQFFEAALKVHPDIPAQMRAGEFGTLHGWLKDNLYQHGSKFTAAELMERATGGPLNIKPYMRYLRTKFGGLYRLSEAL
jgi:carboxypeptidase Taq